MATRVNVLNLTNMEVLKTEMSEHDYIFTVDTIYKPKCCQKCWKAGMDKVHKHGSRERIIRDLNFQGKRVGIKILGIDEAHLNKVMRGVFTNVEKNTILDITETKYL